MDKKSFIGLLIIMLIIFLYPSFIAKMAPPQKAVSPVQEKLDSTPPLTETDYTLPLILQPVESNEAVHDTVIENSRLRVILTNKGAAIKEIRLIRFADRYYKDGLIIFSPMSYENNLFTWDRPFFGYDLNKVKFAYTEEPNRVIYRFILPSLAVIEKTFSLEENSNLIKMKIGIKNLGTNPLPAAFSLICAGGLTNTEAFEERYVELDFSFQGKIERQFLRQIKKSKNFAGPINWLALKNKYFCQILTPASSELSFLVRRIDDKNLEVVANSPTTIIGPRGIKEEEFMLFTGPLDTELLAEYNNEWPKIINFGFFGAIARLILRLLNIGFMIFKNYGIAIIILSLLANIVLFPFTWKSMKSMHKLQALQPRMEALRKEHSSNPQKMNKEILELYKKNKVNPLGGCLPMILQTPVFIALYQVLSRAIQLKGAHFLWIEDLAGPDAFVKFPAELPIIGGSLNLLPLIMIAGVYLQQKRSPANVASQKQMMLFMPLLMGIFFYNLPSGLMLYWVVSTFLSIGLQSSILTRNLKVDA